MIPWILSSTRSNLDPGTAKLAGGVHRLDGQPVVVLDADRVPELVPAQLAA